MFRTISLTAVCLVLASSNSAWAQKPFTNKTALAAQKAYNAAIAKAKNEYVAQLEVAAKEAGGAGHLEEAQLIVTEEKRVEGKDPLTALRRRLTGTRWNSNRNKPRQWQSFEKYNIGKKVRRSTSPLVRDGERYGGDAKREFNRYLRLAF